MSTETRQSGPDTPRFSPWWLRIPAAVVLVAVLGVQFPQVERFGSAVMYAATWIILLHVMVGEYIFIRYLHAVSRVHQLLDAFAALLLLGGVLAFRQAAVWCAFLAGAFALAIVKYLLVEQHIEHPILQRYTREKIAWESPAVCLFSALAVLIDRLPSEGVAIRLIELLILSLAALFAIWMIGIRHLYRQVARDLKSSGAGRGL
jgi:hypothetical protein